MPARRVALACLLGVLAAAAPASARSSVDVSGRVVDGSGRPVRGALVSFELRPDLTLYNQADCPVRPWEIQCKVHKVARRTDSSGRYRLPVKLSSFLATMRSHHLVVTDAPSKLHATPATTETTMYFTRKDIRVPDLPVWRGRVIVGPANAGKRVVHVDQLGSRYGTTYSTGPVVSLLQGDDAVWTFPEMTEDREVDARVVEHGTTGASASDVRLVGSLPVTYRSPRWRVSDGLKPVSRGAACSTYRPGDTLVALPGCRYTDGRLAAPISATYLRANDKACNAASQCANPRRVVVDLGALTPVGAVTTRGCTRVGATEVSAEGTVFAPYPTHDFGDGLPVGGPVPARYVRVDLSKCTFTATEISVFAAL